MAKALARAVLPSKIRFLVHLHARLVCSNYLQRGFLVGDNVIETLYAMMPDEITHPQYDEREIAMFKDPIFYYGRYLNPITRRYAICNVVSSIFAAITYLKIGGASQRRVVDLGCCRKRKRYFEARLGRALKMEFLQADFRAFDPDSIGQKYHALFSMSAFAHIPPLKDTVAKISALLNDSGRVFRWDQNPDYLFLDVLSRKRKAVPRPQEIVAEFARQGFTTDLLGGACAIPRHFWRSDALLGVTSKLNDVLKKSLRLSFSYLLAA